MHHRIVAVTNMRKAACGVCSKPMIASRRGRNRSLVYICREHRERGDASCANATGVPAADLHVAVITSLRSSFTEQSLVEHLEAAGVEHDGQGAA